MPDNCLICKYNTNDFVCHPHCGGCSGTSHYERGNFKLKNYNELAKAIHQNAVDHGWWEEERSFPEVVALIHSELSEALEEFRSGKPFFYYEDKKPEGVAVELADCIIRILDYCGRRKIDIDAALDLRRAGNDTYTLPELIAECHYLMAQAYKDVEPRSLYFAECISLVRFWCAENGADIDEAIVLKHEYNKTRPYKHGGKKC
ncbi:hypothetical protein UNSWDHB_2619 [Dehalobacter sp. UNSWDHB]|uniref:hypothetical protein n=1 Tax=Dehalobacter sp. UNSWDHB TaxID=1339256 RepID=UPI00038799C7|nr:hypothetical protein [Dehalobacter sp. UNSWDHB]EQB20033.1 hypothetical protein UNSWDHB_2619 [Dehalobacter sp. UNSWDHB]